MRDPNIDALVHDIETQMREVEEIAHLGTWRWEVGPNAVQWSPALARIFGLSPEETPATFAAYLEHVHPDDRDQARAQVEQGLASGEPYDNEYRIVRKDGEVRWVRSRGRVIADGRASMRMIGVCQDVTEERLAHAELTTLAMHDSLTGLPERTLFIDRVEQAIKRMARSPKQVAVLFMDVDRFKRINDRLGHAAGDEVLRMVATRLKSLVRPGDTVARLGGDEFAIFCEGVTVAEASDLAARVVQAMGTALIVDRRRTFARVSIGVALSNDARTSAEALLRDADAAMYAAKNSGRNGFVVFDDATRVRNTERLRRADELGSAIASDGLRVFYQPDIDLATGSVVGVEALVRWQHPSLGLVGPDQFIRAAEDSGVVVQLGEWVLRTACAEVATWPLSPQGQKPVLAVNLSAAQLSQPHFADVVRRIIVSSGLEPAQLCLEITESVLMDEVEASVSALADLKALGVRLAIDDFGTGYSSLSYLRRFPVDIVKIDRSFVANLGIDAAADAIVAAVVNLSHALGLRVVAEGVENDDQLVSIRALGCDRAQGYYWSPALPVADMGLWSEAARRLPSTDAVALQDILAERIDTLRAATKRMVVVDMPPRLGAVGADPRALKTLFDHLLLNAVTYSGEDRPIVVSGAADRHWVRVSIADFGVGMTNEEAARCFEQFWQASDTTTRQRGTGMGLYIVRSLVESMGGHISVKSQKGKGSTFTVALPRATRAGRPRLAPVTGPPRDRGEDSSIREFMRQLGVPTRRGA